MIVPDSSTPSCDCTRSHTQVAASASPIRAPIGCQFSKVERRPFHGSDFTGWNREFIDGQEIIGINTQGMSQDIACAGVPKIEIRMMGQIDNCGFIRHRGCNRFLARCHSSGYRSRQQSVCRDSLLLRPDSTYRRFSAGPLLALPIGGGPDNLVKALLAAMQMVFPRCSG